MTDQATGTDEVCYRHPDRTTGIHCQRCDKPICPDCMNSASVGFQCPDCWGGGQQNDSAPTKRASLGRGLQLRADKPYVSLTLLVLNVAVFLYLRNVSQPQQTDLMMYGDLVTEQPWRLITAAFAHVGFVHIAMNMFMLAQLGPPLETMLGKVRFTVLYLVSALGGSLAVWVLAPQALTLGASGAILGLVGALFVFTRKGGGDVTPLLIYLMVIAYISFAFDSVSWQGHLGGFVAGLLCALVLLWMRPKPSGPSGPHPSDPPPQA